jgi:hypothetical protein
MSVVYDDFYYGNLGKFKKTSIDLNPINLLFEIKLGKHFALKTGTSLLRKSGGYNYTHTEGFWENGKRYTIIDKNWPIEFSYFSIDFPILFTYNFIDPDIKYRLNLNFGPYLGYFFPSTFYIDMLRLDPGDFYRLDYGSYTSAGIGLKKWQLNFFYSKGLRNISNSTGIKHHLIRAKNNVTGINLIRVIDFSKKEPKPK